MERPMDIVKYLVGSMFASLALAGCTKYSSSPNVELIQDMMDSPAVRAQEAGPAGMRRPPEGTVPRGFEVYQYKGNPAAAEAGLKNEVAVNSNSLARGEFLYKTYCYVCHGATGKGDGPVAAKMSVKPPALVSDKVKAFKDGRIFH